MMITCVVAFTLCWLPLNIFIIIGDHYPEIYQYDNIEYVWVACHWLAMSHASYNPFIYIWMNVRFRNGFRYVIQRFCCCNRNQSPFQNVHNYNHNNNNTTAGNTDGLNIMMDNHSISNVYRNRISKQNKHEILSLQDDNQLRSFVKSDSPSQSDINSVNLVNINNENLFQNKIDNKENKTDKDNANKENFYGNDENNNLKMNLLLPTCTTANRTDNENGKHSSYNPKPELHYSNGTRICAATDVIKKQTDDKAQKVDKLNLILQRIPVARRNYCKKLFIRSANVRSNTNTTTTTSS